MIAKITIQNFRCYDAHEVELKNLSIIVGKNNAGKSSLIEALRIASIVSARYKNSHYKTPPKWLDISKRHVGISPSLKGIEISSRGIFHQYNNPPAKITVEFFNQRRIEIYIGAEGSIHAVIFDESGDVIENKGQAKTCDLPLINILPQIGPMLEEEGILEPGYVKSSSFSTLASRHFRNQLQYFPEYYKEFKELSEETWEGLEIKNFTKGNRLTDQKPSLFVRDGEFVAEIGWMGHGLQMWLQTMWFVAKSDKNSTVILDEPDVYLHADVQRRLIRFLKTRFNQVIIATHSIEIISEVDPENILIIDKKRKKSKFANNLPAVQEIISSIGSIHNLSLIRYWSSGKVVILESDGDDLRILKFIKDKLFPNSKEPLDLLPVISVEGWSGWQKVIGSQLALKNSNHIKLYCIFDSDYHLEEDKNKRYEDAKKLSINLHIWNKKEIENYLIIPTAIYRFIENRKKKGVINLDIVLSAITSIVDAMKDDTIDCFSSEFNSKNRTWDISSCNKKAREKVEENWQTLDAKLKIVSGKQVITSISQWSQSKFGVSFSKFNIAQEIQIIEIPAELKEVLIAIEKREDFLSQ